MVLNIYKYMTFTEYIIVTNGPMEADKCKIIISYR